MSAENYPTPKKTKSWRVRAITEDGTTEEAYVVEAFAAFKDPEGNRVTPFVFIESENTDSPCLTPAQAERFAAALIKAAKYARGQ